MFLPFLLALLSQFLPFLGGEFHLFPCQDPLLELHLLTQFGLVAILEINVHNLERIVYDASFDLVVQWCIRGEAGRVVHF